MQEVDFEDTAQEGTLDLLQARSVPREEVHAGQPCSSFLLLLIGKIESFHLPRAAKANGLEKE